MANINWIHTCEDRTKCQICSEITALDYYVTVEMELTSTKFITVVALAAQLL